MKIGDAYGRSRVYVDILRSMFGGHERKAFFRSRLPDTGRRAMRLRTAASRVGTGGDPVHGKHDSCVFSFLWLQGRSAVHCGWSPLRILRSPTVCPQIADTAPLRTSPVLTHRVEERLTRCLVASLESTASCLMETTSRFPPFPRRRLQRIGGPALWSARARSVCSSIKTKPRRVCSPYGVLLYLQLLQPAAGGPGRRITSITRGR